MRLSQMVRSREITPVRQLALGSLVDVVRGRGSGLRLEEMRVAVGETAELRCSLLFAVVSCSTEA